MTSKWRLRLTYRFCHLKSFRHYFINALFPNLLFRLSSYFSLIELEIKRETSNRLNIRLRRLCLNGIYDSEVERSEIQPPPVFFLTLDAR